MGDSEGNGGLGKHCYEQRKCYSCCCGTLLQEGTTPIDASHLMTSTVPAPDSSETALSRPRRGPQTIPASAGKK